MAQDAGGARRARRQLAKTMRKCSRRTSRESFPTSLDEMPAKRAFHGGGGNRTRVRGRTGQSIYKRSLGFDFARRPVPRRPTDGLAILKRRTAGDWLSLGAEPERWRRLPDLGPSQERRRRP